MENTRIGGSAELELDVVVDRSIRVGKRSEIGLGGVQITASDDYQPAVPGSFLIDEEPLMDRSEFMDRLKTIQAIEDPEQRAAALAEAERYLLFAQMSEQVYGTAPNRIGNWEKIYDTADGKTAVSNLMRVSGGHVAVYYNKLTNEMVTVFEGTKNPAKAKSLAELSDSVWDIVQNIHQSTIGSIAALPVVLGMQGATIMPLQYEAGNVVLEDVWQKLGKRIPGVKMVVTGHSLGGGIAQYAGAKFAVRHPESNVEGVIFNSADLGYVADDYLLSHRNELDNISMTHIRIDGDPVSAATIVPMQAAFPNSTLYELPSCGRGMVNHGMDSVLNKLGENLDHLDSYEI
jgi:hypothetical protein